MVVCDPPVKEVAIESDTPWIDELERQWPPERFFQGWFRSSGTSDRMCAFEAMTVFLPVYPACHLFDEVFEQTGRYVYQINDEDGRDAVLAALRTAERAIHGDL